MEEHRPIDPKRGLLTLLVLALLMCVLYWLGMWLWYRDWKQGADFGNAFGAANALFSGLAFAAVIFAIFLQHREIILAHSGLKQAVDAQKKTDASLRQTMELDILVSLFGTYRDLRERHRAYTGPDPIWSWKDFNAKYPTAREKQKSYEWEYLTDYGGFFELCGICLRQGYVSDNLVKMLPRAGNFWGNAEEIVLGMRREMGPGLWGSWEYFAKRQQELIQTPLEDA